MKGALKYFNETVILENTKVYWKGLLKDLKYAKSTYIKELFAKVVF